MILNSYYKEKLYQLFLIAKIIYKQNIDINKILLQMETKGKG